MKTPKNSDLLAAMSAQTAASTWQPPAFLLLALAVGAVFAALPPEWSAALLAAVAVLLLILVFPLLGVGLVLLVGPLGALEKVVLQGSSIGSGQLLLAVVIGAWLAGGAVRRRLYLPHNQLGAPLLIFVGAAAVTVPGATSVDLGLKELLKWIEIGVIMVMVIDLASRASPSGRRAVAAVLGMLLLAGLSQALAGIWQFGIRGHGPEHFVVLGRFYRAYGTFEQPNPFGGFMSLSAFLGIGAFAGMLAERVKGGDVKGNGEKSATRRSSRALIGAGACAVTCTLALLLSWSRGAWLGFAAGSVVFVLLLPRKIWHGMAAVLVVVALAGGLFVIGASRGVLPVDLVQRITNINQGVALGDVRGVDINDANFAVLERLAHWQAAAAMARDHLWTGVGLGNYEAVYPLYALINWPDALGHAHNYYLNLLAEVGLPGLFAYLLLWGSVMWRTLQATKKEDWQARGIALGLLAAWTALSVHHLADKLYVNNIYLQIGVMFGLVHLLNVDSDDKAEINARGWAVS